MHKKWLTVVTAMALIFGATQMSVADKGGAPGARAGGMSSDHMSPTGQADSNAQNREGATRGMDRAQERMSDQGQEHGKGGQKAKKHKKNKDEHKNRERDKDKDKDKDQEKKN